VAGFGGVGENACKCEDPRRNVDELELGGVGRSERRDSRYEAESREVERVGGGLKVGDSEEWDAHEWDLVFLTSGCISRGCIILVKV
jgi:hypothetical protein